MAQINVSPQRIAAASLWSGGINTGEMQVTAGGQTTFAAFSGGLITLGSGATAPLSNPGTGHAVIVSGPGRLKVVLTHQVSTAAHLTFYDSNVAAISGVGTYAASGWKPLIRIPTGTDVFGVVNGGPIPVKCDLPFNNGLSVDAASGAAGFTVTWVPQTPVGSGAVSTQN